MKGLEDQTFYEILEISPKATAKEIQRAYEHAKETFHADSLAIYSLFSEEEVNKIKEAIEEAYRVLMDEGQRKHYDQTHFQEVGGKSSREVSEVKEIYREKKDSLSFTGISFNTEEDVYRGKTLKQVRERIGIELQTVSKETKVNIKILEWIEEEATENLPALVYLKGFLKSYAQSLGLDPQKVVEGYLRFLNESKNK